MSACIRIKILGGTSIENAYSDCARMSFALGGMSVETTFNGVEMFYYHGLTRKEWCDDYHRRIQCYGKKEQWLAEKGGAE